MLTVKLKNGETVQVPLEEFEEFLAKNREHIQIQHKKMKKRRHVSDSVTVSNQQ